MNRLAIFLINIYQRFISPRKGFRCAYGALHGNGTCSQRIKDIICQFGVVGGYKKIKQQFSNCKLAYVQLQKNPELDKGKKDRPKKKRRRDQCDFCDCPGSCEPPSSCKGGGGGGGGKGCDLPCDIDLPCDCSL